MPEQSPSAPSDVLGNAGKALQNIKHNAKKIKSRFKAKRQQHNYRFMFSWNASDFTFIAREKFVLNYAKSSEKHPLHKTWPWCLWEYFIFQVTEARNVSWYIQHDFSLLEEGSVSISSCLGPHTSCCMQRAPCFMRIMSLPTREMAFKLFSKKILANNIFECWHWPGFLPGLSPRCVTSQYLSFPSAQDLPST